MSLGDAPAIDLSTVLFTAWRAGPDQQTARGLLHQLPVPGTIGLRGRFHLLTDFPIIEMLEPASFEIERDTWDRQVALTDEADAAIVDHEVGRARQLLEELRDSVRQGEHRLPLVDAMIGLADVARQSDELETAAAILADAIGIAMSDYYRFGLVRAYVSAGYLTMQASTASNAVEQFEAAASIARELDERVYLANALTGLGEAKGRLRDDDGAERALAEALSTFESIRSYGGIVNAAQHLGDLRRRRRQFDLARSAFTRARDVSEERGPLIGLVNATDGLSEVALGEGDLTKAVEHYSQSHQISSEAGYARGQAHALHGLGRCAAAVEEWQLALDLYSDAVTLFRQLDDLPSSTNVLDGMAQAAEASGDLERSVAHRLDAVEAIEAIRAAQPGHGDQQEFRHRFASVYSSAMATAVRAESSSAFVAVFEGLAGRRLAGLLNALPSPAAVADLELEAGATALAHHLPLSGGDLDSQIDTAARRARLVGRLSLRHALPERVEQALADIASALYRPFSREAAAPLLDRLRAKSELLAMSLIPGGESEVVWLHASRDTPEVRVGRDPISSSLHDLLTTLAEQGLPADATPGYVDSLRDLLPPLVAANITSRDGPLLIVPLGALWAIPWPAVPMATGEFLGEVRPLALSPSLTLADHLGSRAPTPPREIAQWRSSSIIHHQLVAFADDRRVDLDVLTEPSAALTAMVDAQHDLVIVAGHGRPVPGVGHYLELDPDVLVDPSAFLTARCPEQLVLVACWGAHAPGLHTADPLTLATIALTRGALAVAATTSELADDPVASSFLNSVLYRMPETSMPAAIHTATRRLLKNGSYRHGFLSRWAPLITVGVPHDGRIDAGAGAAV